MIAGYGEQVLAPLTEESAHELIKDRLNREVWNRLPGVTPPHDHFPFTTQSIRELLGLTNGEVREFLRFAEQEFQKLVITPPRLPQPFTLTQIEPSAVLSHERTAILIRGENLPENVRVAFGELPAVDAVCRPAEGEIEATAPAGLRGDVQVRVEDAADAENWAIIALRYADRTPSKPYCNSLSGAKFRKQRLALGLIQKEVAKRIGVHVNTIGNIERETLSGRADENYEKLAKCYEKPLHFFLRGEGDDT